MAFGYEMTILVHESKSADVSYHNFRRILLLCALQGDSEVDWKLGWTGYDHEV